ncbi:MAG: radical SAM protein [Methanobacteriota archaeon]
MKVVEKKSDKPKVLFAAEHWPTGLVDVASWLYNKKIANTEVIRFQPNALFAYPIEWKDQLPHFQGSGIPLPPKMRYVFNTEGIILSDDAKIAREDEKKWRITDEVVDREILIKEQEDRLVFYEPANKKLDEVYEFLHDHAGEDESLRRRFFDEEGALKKNAEEAVVLLGGDFIMKMLEEEPDVIGFRAEDMNRVGNLGRRIKAVKLFSDAWVVIGGPAVTQEGPGLLEASGADFAFAGEAEEGLDAFIRNMRFRKRDEGLKHADLAWMVQVPGFVYRFGGNVYHNTLPEDGYGRNVLDGDLTHFGLDREKLLQLKRPYLPEDKMNENPLQWKLLTDYDSDKYPTVFGLFYHGARGCRGICYFCERLHGREYRAKSPELMMDELTRLDEAVEEGRITTIPPLEGEERSIPLNICEDDFFQDRERALAFLNLWEKSHLSSKYRLSVDTNPHSLMKSKGEVDERPFKFFERLGMRVQLGVETFHPDVLKRFRKPHSTDDAQKVLDRLEAGKIGYATFQIIADDNSNPSEIVDSIRLLALQHIPRKHMIVTWNPMVIPGYETEARRSFDAIKLEPGEKPDFRFYRASHPERLDPLSERFINTIHRNDVDIQLRPTTQSQRKKGYLHLLDKMRQDVEAETGEDGRDYNYLLKEIQFAQEQIQALSV